MASQVANTIEALRRAREQQFKNSTTARCPISSLEEVITEEKPEDSATTEHFPQLKK